MGGPICGLVDLPLARWWVVHVLHELSCACQNSSGSDSTHNMHDAKKN